MDSEERSIYQFLKVHTEGFLAAREICRHAGGKQAFRQNAEWAKPVLLRMVERGILETDGSGHYGLKLPKRNDRMQRWVSPDVAAALRRSGKNFESIIKSDTELDDYYDQL